MGLRDASGPTPRLSRAAERATIERHGHVKEYMFVNSGWRRRLQALLGRGMADDGPSGCPTVNTAGTPKSPQRAGTHRDVIRRRAIRHAIRRRAIRYAIRRRAIRYAIRRRTLRHARPSPRDEAIRHTIRHEAIGHTTTLLCPTMSDGPVVRRPGGAAARWPDDVLLCPNMSEYVRLCPVMSDCRDYSAPCIAEVSLAHPFGMRHDVRAAQR